MNAVEIVNGEEVQVRRLSAGERQQAIQEFVQFRLGADCSDEEYVELASGCEVLYRDDYDTGRSWFQVVDAAGHGDGSGEWTEVV